MIGCGDITDEGVAKFNGSASLQESSTMMGARPPTLTPMRTSPDGSAADAFPKPCPSHDDDDDDDDDDACCPTRSSCSRRRISHSPCNCDAHISTMGRASIISRPASVQRRKRRRHQSVPEDHYECIREFGSGIHGVGRIGRSTATSLSSLPLLCILLLLCNHSSTVIGSPAAQMQRHHPYNASFRKRRNNTGFYYGIRDDDMTSSSSATTASSKSLLSPLSRFRPVMNSLTSTLHHSSSIRVPAHFSAFTRGQQGEIKYDLAGEQGMNQQQGENALSGIQTNDGLENLNHPDDTMVSTHPARTPVAASSLMDHHHPSSLSSSLSNQLNSSFSSTLGLREKLAQCISQSLIQQQQQYIHQHPGWGHRNTNMSGGSAADSVLSKAISLLGGATTSVVSGQHRPQSQLINEDDNAILHTSTKLITKPQQKMKQKQQKQQQKKRRKNNTGFYYGIRDEVLLAPDGRIGTNRYKRDQRSSMMGLPAPSGSSNDDVKMDSKQMPGDDDGTVDPPQATPDRQEPQERLIEDEQPQKQRPKSFPRMKSNNKNNNKPKNNGGDSSLIAPGMSDVFSETMFELREMKEEIVALRAELRAVKDRFKGDNEQLQEQKGTTKKDKSSTGGRWRQQQDRQERQEDESTEIVNESEFGEEDEEQQQPSESEAIKKPKHLRRRKYEEIGKDVEVWATDLLFEGEDRAADGFKEVSCNNFVRKKYNKSGRTQVYLKWMPDTRNEEDIESTSSHTQDYPCLKCYATIDAPIHQVCSFLANEDTIPLYNDLVTDHSDVEEITPHSKITWCKAPKILFVKPRDFVTYCSHRWGKDGTQVLINQACEHEDKPGVLSEGQGVVSRGFALRGANFISKDPDDPNKTRITMLSHANPGGGLPQWAMNTAVNAVVQIEPFKFFHNINDSIRNYQEEDSSSSDLQSQTSNVGINLPGRSNKPAGIAHLGFTCFWPNGGGLKESGNPFTTSTESNQSMWENETEEEDEDEHAIESIED